MYLKLDDFEVPMKLVYQLVNDFKKYPERVALQQALTLDDTRPKMGYKGVYGLYGSEEWWANIGNGNMPRRYVSGVIVALYHAGQDEEDDINSFDLSLDDGSTKSLGIYCDNDGDIDLFRLGCRVDIFSVFDPLKYEQPPVEGIEFAEIVVEIAVSIAPVTPTIM
ncbi:hypothetical protein IV454_10755 [Massilia antarctica]|uniref:Uncharacterized protein n=1 Tax=Massilia antarctica TaxID=2765360 RepID=A0AA48WHQ3_9BURK|nr:hypothetical protein [Massilia antarctica]QPI51928.1 hypothetical protein IV454_10755 [Massilia antarctica]